MTTAIDGLLVSSVTDTSPEYSLTEPLLVVMVRGGKRLLLGDRVVEYRGGEILVVTAQLPVSGHFFDCGAQAPALAVGLVLRAPAIAELLLHETSAPRRSGTQTAMATGRADPELLDAVLRMVRLLEHPADAAVLGPLIEQEILWRLLRGPHAGVVAQIGAAGSGLT